MAPHDLDLRGIRILVLPPTKKDGEVTRSLLIGAGLDCLICQSLCGLIEAMRAGAGAAVLTEEALGSAGIEELLSELAAQPAWSDFPLVVLMRGGAEAPAAARALRALRNVTLLEMPAPMRSVISAAAAAVRARLRQYQIRDQLDTINRLLESERASRSDAERSAHEAEASASEAERAGRMKDEFLATLSHELRTPLNAILGWAQLLRQAAGDPADLSAGLEVIERNARLQAQLIDDLLDMSRIISGKLRLDVRVIDPSAIVNAAIDSVRPAADAKGVSLGLTPGEGAASVTCDPGRLQQVLWNLLTNAVKFTPRGGRVVVSCQAVESKLVISVTDSGVGIAPEFLPHVFERFRQADASTTRTYGGLGLGLAIVKTLVELHGGTAHATSPGIGQGATFSVELPLAAVRTSLPETTGSGDSTTGTKDSDWNECDVADLSGLRVLVVDDDADARRLIRRVLVSCKADVTTAGSGAEALELLSRSRPDVLVSDIGMPAMDGYEFIRQVRAAHPDHPPPAVALTAFARPEDRQRAISAGYQSHVTKPVEPARLVAVVANLGGRAVAAPAKSVGIT